MFLCPVESPCRITQRFGQRQSVYGPGGHNGLDFTGPRGERVPVVAPYDCTVHAVRKHKKDYGLHLVLWTDLDDFRRRREIILAHFAWVYVKEGDRIAIGDRVGMMGDSGFADGIHVHACMRRIMEHGEVLNEGNGHDGWLDFEPYLLFWKRTSPEMVSYPYP